jgi:hypothetical protein
MLKTLKLWIKKIAALGKKKESWAQKQFKEMAKLGGKLIVM